MIAYKSKPFSTGTLGLFAKKAICANCGYTMRSSISRGKHYLKCSSRHVSKDSCIGSFISVDSLEKRVIDELNKLSAEFLNTSEVEQNIKFCNDLQEQKTKTLSEIACYQKKIAEYTKGIKDLYVDKIKGIVSESDFIDLSKDFTSEKTRLERLIVDCQKKIDAIDDKIEAGDNRREVVEKYMNLAHLNRPMVEVLIDHISVYKRVPGTYTSPIEIHWNF